MKTFLYTITALAFIAAQPVVSNAQTYSIPWAQQQPAWVMPLIFQDGTGARDTIYFSYDPAAYAGFNVNDTIFGEQALLVDTTAFHAGWGVVGGNSAELKVDFYPAGIYIIKLTDGRSTETLKLSIK